MRKLNLKFFCMLFVMFILANNVYAASYSVSLKTDNSEVNTGATVDVYVNLNNISGISDGLNACEFKLEYDTNKITVNSVSGENSWNITNGEKVVADTSNAVKSDTNIAKINVTVNGKTNLYINNIVCTDGEDEYSASKSNVSFTIKSNANSSSEPDSSNNNNNNTNSSNANSNTSNVNNPETGISIIYIICLLMFLILSLVISLFIRKKYL